LFSINQKDSLQKKAPSNIHIDEFIRSRRHTIGLQISSDGRLIVRAPLRTSLKEIQSFIAEKEDWILKTQLKVKERAINTRARSYSDGESYPFLGHNYILHIDDSGSRPLQFDNAFYLSQKLQPKAEKLFRDWYRKQALSLISLRVELFAEKFGLRYSKVGISNARRRWGSCSPKGNLNFSWRLAMAPVVVIDYVVIHELAHLLVKNHSSHFWKKVEEMMPDYKVYRKWLRDNESNLAL
jgi:predicted metal-dependent hydrolase